MKKLKKKKEELYNIQEYDKIFYDTSGFKFSKKTQKKEKEESEKPFNQVPLMTHQELKENLNEYYKFIEEEENRKEEEEEEEEKKEEVKKDEEEKKEEEEINEPTIQEILSTLPIKISFMGSLFSGKKTQAKLLTDKFEHLKSYYIPDIIKELKEIKLKSEEKIEDNPKFKSMKKNQIEQLKEEKISVKNFNELKLDRKSVV